MAYETALSPAWVQVPGPVKERLAFLQTELRLKRGRPVPYGEVVELLLDVYDELDESDRK